jgi:hypothetical protein
LKRHFDKATSACVYLAKDADIIRKHTENSGLPATAITQVLKVIDPTTETPEPIGD